MWTVGAILLFADNASQITSTGVTFETTSKTYGACPSNTLAETSFTDGSVTCPSF